MPKTQQPRRHGVVTAGQNPSCRQNVGNLSAAQASEALRGGNPYLRCPTSKPAYRVGSRPTGSDDSDTPRLRGCAHSSTAAYQRNTATTRDDDSRASHQRDVPAFLSA